MAVVDAIAALQPRRMTKRHRGDIRMGDLPVLLVGQAIFSGGVARLEGAVRTFARAVVSAYWALDGFRSTFAYDRATIAPPPPPPPPAPPPPSS